MKDRIKLKIGDFSRLMQVSMRTLRYYEEIGLLKPYEVDEWTGYRYYLVKRQDSDIIQFKQIPAIPIALCMTTFFGLCFFSTGRNVLTIALAIKPR